jgi:hypothetical protein
MGQGRIPPDESHPRYREWLAASIRLLDSKKKLESMTHVPETDSEFSAALLEWHAATRAYEAIVAKII